MSRAVIGLGSNLGDRAGNLRLALAILEERGSGVVRRSAIWRSAPVPADQPEFLNAAAVIETGLDPVGLLALLKDVEATLGRRPGRRWGPRPIDLDLLFYDDTRVDSPGLTVPHPRIEERAFVLAPLVEVLEPGSPRQARCFEALRRVGSEGVRRTPLLL